MRAEFISEPVNYPALRIPMWVYELRVMHNYTSNGDRYESPCGFMRSASRTSMYPEMGLRIPILVLYYTEVQMY